MGFLGVKYQILNTNPDFFFFNGCLHKLLVHTVSDSRYSNASVCVWVSAYWMKSCGLCEFILLHYSNFYSSACLAQAFVVLLR